MPRSRTLLLATPVVFAIALPACGGGSSPSSSTTPTNAGRPASPRRGFLRDPTVQACLKQQGIKVPTRPRGGTGTGTGRPRVDAAQVQKIRAALQKCGVTLPARPPGGGRPPTTTGAGS